jgi:hypothetical protein
MMKGGIYMAKFKFNKNAMINEIMRQMKSKVPSEIDYTLLCDEWGSIWCRGEITDESGRHLPRKFACRNCIEKSLNDNPKFVKQLLERYWKNAGRKKHRNSR